MPTKKDKTKVSDPASAKEIQHYNAVLIEELKSQFQMVTENTKTSEERLTKNMNERFAEQDDRFKTFEIILKYHTELFWKNDKRWEDNGKRFVVIEKKLDTVIEKLDKVSEKVDRHDQEIHLLKAASA